MCVMYTAGHVSTSFLFFFYVSAMHNGTGKLNTSVTWKVYRALCTAIIVVPQLVIDSYTVLQYKDGHFYWALYI